MKVPQLKKKTEIKTCHNIDWQDDYSWVHQSNILDVLKDSSKLDPEVKKYLEEENAFTDYHLKDTKKIQKELFDEIKGRIKLNDESIPFKDTNYEYWTKTTEEGNYSIKLRKKNGTNEIEEYWNGDKEKKKLNTEYFGVGDLEVSYNDQILGYSLDLKGSEYFSIYLRNIKTNELISEKIEDTSGNITFSLDDKYIFYSKLDKFHRPRKIFRHKIGTSISNDILIFEEQSEAFTVGIGLTSDEKYFIITTSDHNTSEQFYFGVNEEIPKPKIIKKRERGIIYSTNSWNNNFYLHTNENAEDFKIDYCDDLITQNWKPYIAAQEEVLIGGLTFLKNWTLRSEVSNALAKVFVKNELNGKEEEITFTDEIVIDPGISRTQKDRNTDNIYLSYSSPKTQSRTYLYNLKSKERKLIMPISISIASGKGGVGKTSIAVNLALTMASLGSRVTFLDADFGLANAHLLMGYNPANTVRDAISGKSDLRDSITKGPLGLQLISGGNGLLDFMEIIGRGVSLRYILLDKNNWQRF